MGVTSAEVLARPVCDVVLVRGPFPEGSRRVLLPMRGGPHAELALRLGLSLRPEQITTLHLTPPGEYSDAPFRGLEQILRRLPELQTRTASTKDPAQTILDNAPDFNLVVIGVSAQPLTSKVSLGTVADRILQESPAAVLAVKTRRPMSAGHLDGTGG
jgi:glucosyl-3-phosphoglycerate synthase